MVPKKARKKESSPPPGPGRRPPEDALVKLRAVEQALREGWPPPSGRGTVKTAMGRAAEILKCSRSNIYEAISTLDARYGVRPDWSLYRPVEDRKPSASDEDIARALRQAPMTLEDLVERFSVTKDEAVRAIERLGRAGANIAQRGDFWSVEKIQTPAFISKDIPVYESRRDGTYLFGVTSDNHLGSRYERLDVLNDLYDRFERAGVDRVFNCGNWIDGAGRAGFNLHELKVHGLDAQMKYLADNYPRRKGIVTYAVSGNDHEGWWAQREGIDVGKYAENKMRSAGREDWVDLGYMEAHVCLRHAKTGASNVMAVVHPGGGTAYALSYSVQKIVEALEGGEKPAVGLYGHYHKLWSGNIRNVWVLCPGCTQDQTSFMRSKIRQEAHVGGAIVEAEQDAESGAIVAFKTQLIRYFNRGYYINGRWSFTGPVSLPERAP